MGGCQTAGSSMDCCQSLQTSQAVWERKQKQGVLAQLRRRPHKPPLVSIFLADTRSLVNTMGDLQKGMAYNYFICERCLLIVAEPWQIPWVSNPSSSGLKLSFGKKKKKKGGGYLFQCSNSRKIERHCTWVFKARCVQCRPFYMPREITVAILTVAYILPDAKR